MLWGFHESLPSWKLKVVSIESWFSSWRDPWIMVYCNPYITGQFFYLLYNLNNQGLFFIAHMLFKVRFLQISCNSPKPKMASNTCCWLICDGILDTAVAPLLPCQTNSMKLSKTPTIVASVKALNPDFGATKCCPIEWFHVVSPVSKCYPNLVPLNVYSK